MTFHHHHRRRRRRRHQCSLAYARAGPAGLVRAASWLEQGPGGLSAALGRRSAPSATWDRVRRAGRAGRRTPGAPRPRAWAAWSVRAAHWAATWQRPPPRRLRRTTCRRRHERERNGQRRRLGTGRPAAGCCCAGQTTSGALCRLRRRGHSSTLCQRMHRATSCRELRHASAAAAGLWRRRTTPRRYARKGPPFHKTAQPHVLPCGGWVVGEKKGR